MGSNHNGVPPPEGYAASGKIMLIAIVALLTTTLLIFFLHLYLRWRVLRRFASARRRIRRRLVFAGETHGALRPADRGLAPDILESLPVLVFSAAGGEGDGEEVVECAVCLNEFVEGEKLRSLPLCGHRFHIECIDMWFHSHFTCPLCRAAVKAASPPVNTIVSVRVLASNPPEAAAEERARSSSGLCSRCRAEGIGSSSATLGCPELRIEAPARWGEGFGGPEEELGLGLGLGTPGVQRMKSPGSRMQLLTRLLSRDKRLYCGGNSEAEPDLERGEGAERSPPPPPPPPPPLPPTAAAL
ncbi:RING-H2 finger protein ATL2-like [Phoenix dactylifera]|uniref:RING-type E3 ubiquitin transferase n=1 Tax=Phoenix dactylifera TaxID=42345 RepID=A0A8B7CBK3_PHODC|nr:RING-H2 finger protein ATL2-like [Phoenix dactylifera]